MKAGLPKVTRLAILADLSRAHEYIRELPEDERDEARAMFEETSRWFIAEFEAYKALGERMRRATERLAPRMER